MEIFKHIHGLLPVIIGEELAELAELFHITSEYAMSFSAKFLKQ